MKINEQPKFRKSVRNKSRGNLKPIKKAQSATRLGANPIRQVVDLCKVIDKEKTGKVKIHNFMRIAKVTGLKISNIELIRFTQERNGVVDFAALTNELLSK